MVVWYHGFGVDSGVFFFLINMLIVVLLVELMAIVGGDGGRGSGLVYSIVVNDVGQFCWWHW